MIALRKGGQSRSRIGGRCGQRPPNWSRLGRDFAAIATSYRSQHSSRVKRRNRKEGSADQQLVAITIFVAVVLIAAVLRLFQRSASTDLVGMLINGLGQLWLPALVSVPFLAIGWRHIVRTHRSSERTASTQAELRVLSPDDFEEWSAKRLRDRGYTVRRTGRQGDHGVDLIATKSGLDSVVQCKRYAGKRSVGEPEVRDLFGVMHHHAAREAILITAGWFTPQAREWAKGEADSALGRGTSFRHVGGSTCHHPLSSGRESRQAMPKMRINSHSAPEWARWH